MTENDECPRCGETENTKHLLWECCHVRQIWNLYNNLLTSLDYQKDRVLSYDDVYTVSISTGIILVKVKLIQALIQIDRPRNWTMLHLEKLINNLVSTDKYNALKTNSILKFNKKWNFLNPTYRNDLN